MKTLSNVALKEWAVVVRAIHDGKQIALLRKGGIADEDGSFRLKEKEFFLYPTYEHQSAHFLSGDAVSGLDRTVRERPTGGKVILDTYAVVQESRAVTTEAELGPLLQQSVWAPAYLQQRLRYKPEKTLLLVTLRAYRLAQPHLIDETPAYAGCVSWVPLEAALSTQPSAPAMNESAFIGASRSLRKSHGPRN